MPDRDHIAALIEATAAQDALGLATSLADDCWPGGGDRRNRIGSEWLRRWRPTPMGATAADCSCAAGRCGWCN
jgi:hypothetical protein